MSRIKECFTSRFGDDGVIMEVDFDQLEVVGLAIISKDDQLIQDINDGLDMHCVSASWVTGEDYQVIKDAVDNGDPHYKKIRQAAKRPRFELQYGAGAPTIAKNNNWPVKHAEGYIQRYYDRYPGVKDWQESIATEVEASSKYKGKKSQTGLPLKTGWHKSPTGRIYTFHEFERYDKSGNPTGNASFSPTQMKNYPVQGFATGDVVPLMGGILFYDLKEAFNRDRVLLVNTVHDSYVLDVHKKALDSCLDVVHTTLGQTSTLVRNTFNIDVPVEIKHGIDYGRNWSKCK